MAEAQRQWSQDGSFFVELGWTRSLTHAGQALYPELHPWALLFWVLMVTFTEAKSLTLHRFSCTWYKIQKALKCPRRLPTLTSLLPSPLPSGDHSYHFLCFLIETFYPETSPIGKKKQGHVGRRHGLWGHQQGFHLDF